MSDEGIHVGPCGKRGVTQELRMRIQIDRRMGFEIYVIVRKWRAVFLKFNRVFCDVRRAVSVAIVDEEFYRRYGAD